MQVEKRICLERRESGIRARFSVAHLSLCRVMMAPRLSISARMRTPLLAINSVLPLDSQNLTNRSSFQMSLL